MLLTPKLFTTLIQMPPLNSALKISAAILLSLLIVSAAQANTISGSISLPSGIVAPNGGLSITVRSLRFDQFGFGRDRVTINSGQSTTNYSLNFSDDTDRDIVFDCEACASLDVTTEGGWSNANGVVGLFSAQTFSGNQNHIVNILLETADTFRGTLSLPPDITAEGGEFLLVSISSSDLFSFDSFSMGEILTAGQTSFNFAVGAPTAVTRSGWEIRFVCVGCASRVESASHYATRANGGIPTLDSDSAFRFRRNSNFSGISLTLIDNQPAATPDVNGVLAPIFLLLDDE